MTALFVGIKTDGSVYVGSYLGAVTTAVGASQVYEIASPLALTKLVTLSGAGSPYTLTTNSSSFDRSARWAQQKL